MSAQAIMKMVKHRFQRHRSFGQKNQKWHLSPRIGESGRGRYEPDFASHRLQYKHRIGRTTPSVFLVGILHHVHPVFRHRTISGRVINEFELAVSNIVVNCFGNANSNQIHPTLSRLLAHLVRGIHRIIAADVEKVADIVSGHHIKRAIEILLLMIFEFVTARADRSSAGSRSQECNFGGS